MTVGHREVRGRRRSWGWGIGRREEEGGRGRGREEGKERDREEGLSPFYALSIPRWMDTFWLIGPDPHYDG